MQQNNHLKNISILVLGAFLVSTSGPLGKYISLPSEAIIWFRSSIAMVFLYAYSKIKKTSLKIKDKKHIKPFIIGGVFTAIHWITYFYALKMSNVAIGMLSLFTFPVIITFLEPIVFKTKFSTISILFGVLVLLGVYILSPDFDIKKSEVQGLLFGLLSALCYCFRTLILKKYAGEYNGITLMFFQVLVITVFLLPVLFFMDISSLPSQLPFLLMLGLVTTAIGHSLIVRSLKFFSASTTSILTSIEPIFGIILAYFFLNEIPAINTYIGGGLILATVIIESIRSRKD